MKFARRDSVATELAQAIFAPRSVALVGASSNPAKNTARPLRYLRKHGYEGRIFPINPGAEVIDGVRAWPSLADAPAEIDHAFIMVGADAVEESVRACADRGIRCATILSDGFAEAGPEGVARQEAVARAAGEGGVRLLGPNSIGVIDTAGFACSANAALAMETLPRGRYGVISQSGSMIGALLSQGAARGIGFSSLVSVGNEIDLTVGEIGEAMLSDPRCEAILLFLEAIRDRAALARFARSAEAAGKPVLAYKLGRSKAGQALAATHTGALAGNDAQADALLAHLGIARVRILETLFEAPPLFLGSGQPEGRRVAVVSTTGGGGAMVVDALASLGMEMAPPLPEVAAILAEHGVGGSPAGLIDLTLAGTRPALVRAVIEALQASDAVDAIAMVIGSSSQFHPELAVAPLRGFAQSAKPLGVYLVPAAEDSRRLLTEEGLAVFRTAESCAEGLRARLERRPPPPEAAPDPALATAVHAVFDEAEATTLDEVQARRVCDLLGIEGPEGGLARSAAEAGETFDRLGGAAVALKIVSPDIPHKSDSGGLILGLATGAEVEASFDRLMEAQRAAHPEARLRGVLVQRMERGVAEALVGFRRDPQLGPVVMLGAGGVLAEVMRDTAIRVAPVTKVEALRMLDAVTFLRAARGFRNRPSGDLDALAEAVTRLSRLALCEDVAEAEINPLLVLEEGRGVRALDALAMRRAD
ncbi:acetate--CoA ligase family protein [Jannaschia seohaensis]|uniref:Acyl-CoA synthetase (NDP forming) n=1 Tax=Jannaschia seohaensis TaxID=475081 RepID=A0A2Y9AJJ9_9RHOB|nr:acetate--CoA ligase family protein [Jannaschia seohaensis]PWJ20585.1 acyl-CoA synthetase (NDP forming) [Jannaschia seohaensis]SSA44681.1 Acyl-CoA synthetase (NDP forming) [Jannaschia seohaensis]